MDAHEHGPWLRRVPEWFLRPCLRLGWGFAVSGLENIPPRGPVIVASNHCSIIDGPLLVMASGAVRELRFPGKISLFRIPLVGWYLKGMGMIPLDRRAGDVAAMRGMLAILADGGSLGIFPEGTRSKTGEPGPAKAGLGFLAGRSGAEVVPARIVGSAGFPAGGALSVRFGAPTRFEGDPEKREDCLAFGEAVMKRISVL